MKPYVPKTNLYSSKFRKPINNTNTNGPTKFRDLGSLIRPNNGVTNQSTFNKPLNTRHAPTKFRSLSELSTNSVKISKQPLSHIRKTTGTGLRKFRNLPKFNNEDSKPGIKHTKHTNKKCRNKIPDILPKMSNRPESYNDGWDMYDENDKEINCIIGGISYKVTIPDNESKENMVKSIQNINSKLPSTFIQCPNNDNPLCKLYLNIKYCVDDWDNIVNLIEKNKYSMDIILEAICYNSYKSNDIDKQYKAIKKKLRQINTLKNKCTNDLNLEQRNKLESEDLLVLKKNTIEYIQSISQSP